MLSCYKENKDWSGGREHVVVWNFKREKCISHEDGKTNV